MRDHSTLSVPCACGCGASLPKYDRQGRLRRFLRGHHRRTNEPKAKKRRTGECVNCGKLRKFAGRGMCSPCYVKWRYLNQEPKECTRCHRVLLPFSSGMCKSCYQIVWKKPDAARQGTPEWREHLSAAQSVNPPLRERSARWKGGRFTDPEGYVRIIRPDDYTGPCIHGGRYVHEHRYIAEKFVLSRPLRPHEVVHHEDENRANNDPANLRVFPSLSAHRRYHAMRWQERHPATGDRALQPTLSASPHTE